ncbi:uncharacterized protein SPSK_03417 [Sporothrix schenckii 1099-18]|uniref:DUF4185 domain-containing protein n=2 Tax=Sporothrix schenckii TaxID=29908 RepID=U7PPU6_SPOS1|nr:uncharacterized protein SPSK_03417 [Sporothrix schenckii 1099-18]ERS97663.1 hypothetical protein HMPREF1624_05834 [Sporothrix schenckii ATCC 58251]KJR82187.1 hypothetical protein SPSK_03417 [Sporothrix schenckii 1099-18]
MDWIKKATEKAKGLVHDHEGGQSGGQYPHQQQQQPMGPPAPGPPSEPVKVDNITTSFRTCGLQQSNFPHVFRDGGGGGFVGGKHLIIFADGMYTKGQPPTDPSRIVSFVSNSIAVAGDGAVSGPPTLTRVTDFGNATQGPQQAVPFLTDQGESAMATAIWPNHNIAPLPGTNGTRGVAFTEVIDRNLFKQQKFALLYNTPIDIHLDAQSGTPVVSRPVKNLFNVGEPMFGSFCIVHPDLMPNGGDGYLYLFGRVSEAANHKSNGLKLARVRPEAFADRRQYEFWDGQQFGPQMPALDDGGAANVLDFSLDAFGKWYGPATGDIWWSPVYNEYIMLFQSGAAAVDDSLYLSHSTSLTGGWTKPVSIYKIPRFPDGYSYAFHAYPAMDPTGQRVPLSWTQDSKTQSCRIYTGEVLFS